MWKRYLSSKVMFVYCYTLWPMDEVYCGDAYRQELQMFIRYMFERKVIRGKDKVFQCDNFINFAALMCVVIHVIGENRINLLRTNSDVSQTSHCNIKGLSVREVMRI